jgi:lipopolysaccharide transport system permease protein
VATRALHALNDRAERMSLAAYFEMLMNLTRREVRGRYSQSLFGAGWAIAQPIAAMAVFTLVFSRLGRMPSDGVPYPLFAYTGLALWFFFANSVNSGTSSLVTYRDIVTKTYFPREIVPLAQVCSRLIDFAATAVLFAVLLTYYGIGISRWVLLAPVFLVFLLLFTVGITLLTSALNVFYRDVNPVVQIVLQLWLYVTPVAYPLSAVPPRLRPMFVLNPLTAIVEGLRSSVLFGRAPDWSLAAVSGAAIVGLLGGAIVTFKRMDRYFADVI